MNTMLFNESFRIIKQYSGYLRDFVREDVNLDNETKLQIDITFGEIQERLDKIKEKIQNV